MRKLIISTIVIVLLLTTSFDIINAALASNFNNSHEVTNNVIYRDDFNSESDYWFWRDTLTAYHFINNGIVHFTIPNATPLDFYVSEIWDRNSTPPYQYNYMKTRIKVDGIQFGSRGWGFWNTNMNPLNWSVAWFMSLKSLNPLYPLDGLWVMCSNGILNGVEFKRVRDVDITKWHEYEINWTKESVDFFIDGKNVAHITNGVPQDNCRIHIWVDNMKWLFIPFPQIISSPTTLSVDYIEINE